MIIRQRIAALAAGLLFTACALLGSAEAFTKTAPANVWPQTVSDIKADTAVRFGTLPNGMRYAILKNATPPGQASLRLRFDAGSLMETDSEQGIAHFLEHMAFNGSEHVPEGEMVKMLERHGLAFGADTNAQTSWTETVYQLDLPHTDDDTVDTSLMLLREAAGNLTLDPGAIDRERGVVLSEERTRDTPGLRVFKAGIGFFLQGQLAASRLPIGQVSVINHADHALLEGFYRRYYRPERAVLVAVGDFDPDAMEAKIRARFSNWAAQGPAGPEPDLGKPMQRGTQSSLVVEPGAPLTVQIEWLRKADRSLDTLSKRQRQLTESLGLAVLNRRLERLARAPSPPFIAAASYTDDLLHSADVTILTISAQPGRWREALTAADQAERRLLEYGMSQAELDREIAEHRVALQAAAASAATRRTPSLANEIAGTLDDRTVYTSPAEDLEEFEASVKGLTAKAVHKQLEAQFKGQGPLVFVASPEPIDGGPEAIAKAYSDSHAAKLSPEDAGKAVTWPYASFGTPGKVAEERDITDLGAVFVRFDNGVRLTIKPTKFRDNQVRVRVRIGHGLLDLPTDRKTTDWAVRGALVEGGLKAITAEDMERVLASNIYGADASSAEDALTLQGSTRPEDLQIQLQVLAAYASQPGLRPEAFQRMRSYASTMEDQLEATPGGVMNRDLGKLMHGGDERFAFPSRKEIKDATPDDFEALMAKRLAEGPIEVVIVGDITVEKAIAYTAATFGALRARADAPVAPESLAVALPAPSANPVVLTHKGRADQAAAYAAWPAAGFFDDPQMARTLRVLAQVIELRLIDDLREKEGTTYSPQAGASASLTFPHYGYVSAAVEVPPAKISDFYANLAKISAGLKSKDVSADELQRAKAPLIDSLEKARQTNDYWLEQLSGAQADPRKLDAIRSVVASLQRVNAAELKQAAQRYLQDGKLWKLEITPQK
jgi:zinc protease